MKIWLFSLFVGTLMLAIYSHRKEGWDNSIPAYEQGYDVEEYTSGTGHFSTTFNEEYIFFINEENGMADSRSGHWLSNSVFLSDGMLFVREINCLIEFNSTYSNIFTKYDEK